MKEEQSLSLEEIEKLHSKDELKELLASKSGKYKAILETIKYEEELRKLQVELVKFQQWVAKNNKRVAVIFEGRDAAGKGGAIRRFMEHLSPRTSRLVALNKPTDIEKGQWYFMRYIKELPNPGEIVFYDRSWYNRAVVEPVMGFCDDKEYNEFMSQVPEFEHMLHEDGLIIVKFWLSISKDEQKKRFNSRMKNPLKRWKFSPVDQKGQELWEKYSHFKEQMYSKTHTSYSPWVIVKTNNKEVARLECIRYVLSKFDYDGKDFSKINLFPDPNVIMHYFRSSHQID